MGTNIRKTLIAIFMIANLLLISTTTLASDSSFPPAPGDMKESLFSSNVNSFDNYDEEPVFFSSNYTDTVIGKLIENLSEPIVVDYIHDLVSFGPRVTGTSACEEAARYIYNEFFSMGLSVRYQNWSSSTNIFGSNIEATLPGFDDTSDKVFIVCGHYDSVPGSPGADDNGAGTTTVLASALLMKDYSFNFTIRFVCFSGEEQGLHGSAFYAQEAVENGDNIIGVLNADMMGYADDDESRSKVKVFDDEDSSIWLTDYTTEVSTKYKDEIGLTVVPSGYTWGSDHYRFWEVGYNAIFYFEDQRNPYYHSSNDTLENMDTEYATHVSQLIIATLASLAEPIDIQCPRVPSIAGIQKGKPDEIYEYQIFTTDPQDDTIYYLIDWGDDTQSGWLGPNNSGEYITISKSWESFGIYNVKIKAKDSDGHESAWSSPYPIRMPYFLFFDSLKFLDNIFSLLSVLFSL